MGQRILLLLSVIALLSMAAVSQAQTPAAKPPQKSPMSKDQKIQNAMSAGPAGIARAAAVMAPGAAPGAPMEELRKGTNGWTCMPDDLGTPANDPMCMDKVAMQWADAWMSKKPVNVPGMGIGYMLQGGATADNDDPFAKTPKAGKSWLMEPPHLMIFGTKIPAGAYPTTPNMTGPWVMWGGTPYEHLMVPVK